MPHKMALGWFYDFSQNIPRTFTLKDSLADILAYFLLNPDYNTAVVNDQNDKTVGIISKNDLLEYLFSLAKPTASVQDLLDPSFPHIVQEQVDLEYISNYIINNYEDLIVLDRDGRYQSLLTCFNLGKILLDQKHDQATTYEAVLNSTPNGLIVVDMKGKVFFLNKAAGEMLACDPKQALGQHVKQIVPNSKLPRVLQTGKSEITKKHYRDGVTFLTTRTPITHDDKMIGAMTQFEAVPDSEDPLSQLADVGDFINLMEMVMDNAYVGLIFCDRAGIIRFMNRLYEDLLGIKRETAYGRHITEYFPDSRLPVVIKTSKPELGWKYNFMGEKTLVVNRIPIKQKGQIIGALAQCIFKDISELKDMASKLDLLETKVKVYKDELNDLLAPKYGLNDILGCSESISRAKKLAHLYAKTDAPVLITGETGTGKELFAHAIHDASPRSQGPFVCLNCASIPMELVESELFGYAPGAFTGAHKRGKIGKIRLAHKGTIFLDEIGDLPLAAQAKLLRVLEEKRVERVGGIHPVEADFRLVAATNKDLSLSMQEGKFREDLYYRLGTMSITVPSLRDRAEDIPILARSFISRKTRGKMKISDQALHLLMNHNWRGNVRELRSIIERALTLMEEGDTIKKEHLASYILNENVQGDKTQGEIDFELRKILKNDEKDTILKAIQFCKGNKARAARKLGISRSLLYNKMKKYDIQSS